MTGRDMVRRWRLCPGCGRERRLAPGTAVMCPHNRWDSAAWAMVACEGSGEPPGPEVPGDGIIALPRRLAAALVRGAV